MFARNWKTPLATLAILATVLTATATAANGEDLAITGPQAPEVPENTTTVGLYTANAPGGTTVAWSLEGADKDLLTITGGTLAFTAAPNHENPSDHDSDNVYEATVVARTDNENAKLDVRVAVSDVNEPPAPKTGAITVPVETGATTYADLTTWFSDPEADTLSFTITTPRDTGLHASIEDNELTLTASGEKRETSITVQATDGQSISTLRATVRINIPIPRPSPPENLQASPTTDGFALTWNSPAYSPGEPFDYSLKYRVADTDASFTRTSTRSESYTLTGLEPNTTYEIKVQACNYGPPLSIIVIICGRYAEITATTLGTNTAPTVAEALSGIYVNPGESPEDIDLSSVFQDAEGDTLHYTATSSNNEIATPTITGATLSITTGATGPLGPATISVTARDRPADDTSGLSVTETFVLTVDYLPVVTIEPSSEEPVSEADQARFTLKTATAPTTAIEVKICVSQGQSNYLAAGMPSSQCDPTGALDVATNRVLATIGFGAGNTSEELILQVDDDFVSETNGQITAMIIDMPTYPYTAGSPNAATVAIEDNDTLVLDVEPRSLRQARLSWHLLPQAEGYEMRIRQQGSPWPSTPRLLGPAHYQEDFNLDAITTDAANMPLGLADSNFEFQIRGFRTTSGNKQFTNYSQTIRLADNPLLARGGRLYSPSDRGTAHLQWTAPPNVTNNLYTIIHRPLRDTHPEKHRPLPDDWPGYGTPSETARTLSGTNPTTTVEGLIPTSLHAFQLRYDDGDTRVFSARDAYVWPESTNPTQANFPHDIAAFPYFGHHADRHYNYIICAGDWTHVGAQAAQVQSQWENLINHVFATWQESTSGWITASEDPNSPRCSYSPMESFIQDDDNQSEIRVLDLTISMSHNPLKIFSFPELRSDPLKACLNQTNVQACVTSFPGYVGTALTDSDRNDIRSLLREAEANGGLPQDRIEQFLTLISKARGAHFPGPHNILTGVDITFRTTAVQPSTSKPNRLTIPTARFNQCLPSTIPGHTPDFAVYELALHEAGHAFGLTSFSFDILINHRKQLYENTHATIPDLVMNYDEHIKEFHEGLTDERSEPDCYPHPLDIMALYALYQNVGTP